MLSVRPTRYRLVRHIALSPSSWGVSGQPGWGHQLDAERVLAEAASLGEKVIEAGPSGFLPDHSAVARPLLKRHGLTVAAGSVDAILHHHDIRGAELAHIDGHAEWLSALGAQTLVLTAIPPRGSGTADSVELSSMGWAHLLHSVGSVEHVCALHRLRLAVQPRLGTMIQSPSDIERLLVGSEAGICLDAGHLLMAGADPIEVLELAAGRIRHVRLNDVDGAVAAQVREYGLDYAKAVSGGLFKPLGTGDAEVARVVESLRRIGYRGWYSLDQDTRLASDADDPFAAVVDSLGFLRMLLA